MKCIMVMFDSLNRRMLPSYGCDWTHAPNFARLAHRTVQFQNVYVCSMPCMPARREMHTGRPNFLHRSWGPLEPFDDSMPELLKKAGIYSHLITDHYHYFEDGGATYHNRFTTWEFFRGQEGDPWIGQVKRPIIPDVVNARRDFYGQQDAINRSFMKSEADMPQAKTFAAGLDFIRRNRDEDKWYLQIETFDPHEPFFADQKYKDLYAKHYDSHRASGGRPFDWPPYAPVKETSAEVEHCRHEYAALLSMCDAHLGQVMNLMDDLDLWKDTMLIVCTDHGFLLGEHECWAKMWMPFYQEVSHTPLFIWDPRSGKRGEKRESLVQTIDFAPTVLEFFGVERPKDMLGKPLVDVVASDKPVREAGIFGLHGAQVNVTDGRYVYMRAPVRDDSEPLFDYTVMPTRMRGPFPVEHLTQTELVDGFSFMKGCRVLKIASNKKRGGEHADRFQNLLYDLKSDPGQVNPIRDAAVEERMIGHLVRLMKECDAPAEQYERLGLKAHANL
jgi:arylsulfatase A-like enzyme